MPLTASASTRRQPTTARSAQAGRSDWLVENEYLGCHVRLEVVGAEERNHSTTGQPLDGGPEVGFHHLPEESASLIDVVVASVVD